jgi:hypothetical protein
LTIDRNFFPTPFKSLKIIGNEILLERQFSGLTISTDTSSMDPDINVNPGAHQTRQTLNACGFDIHASGI